MVRILCCVLPPLLYQNLQCVLILCSRNCRWQEMRICARLRRGTPGCQQWKLSIRISGLARGVARILMVSGIEIIFDGDQETVLEKGRQRIPPKPELLYITLNVWCIDVCKKRVIGLWRGRGRETSGGDETVGVLTVTREQRMTKWLVKNGKNSVLCVTTAPLSKFAVRSHSVFSKL